MTLESRRSDEQLSGFPTEAEPACTSGSPSNPREHTLTVHRHKTHCVLQNSAQLPNDTGVAGSTGHFFFSVSFFFFFFLLRWAVGVGLHVRCARVRGLCVCASVTSESSAALSISRGLKAAPVSETWSRSWTLQLFCLISLWFMDFS